MIYLDNAATSFPKPEGVYAALDRFARTSLANVAPSFEPVMLAGVIYGVQVRNGRTGKVKTTLNVSDANFANGINI